MSGSILLLGTYTLNGKQVESSEPLSVGTLDRLEMICDPKAPGSQLPIHLLCFSSVVDIVNEALSNKVPFVLHLSFPGASKWIRYEPGDMVQIEFEENEDEVSTFKRKEIVKFLTTYFLFVSSVPFSRKKMAHVSIDIGSSGTV